MTKDRLQRSPIPKRQRGYPSPHGRSLTSPTACCSDQVTPCRSRLSIDLVVCVHNSAECGCVDKDLIAPWMLHRQRREFRRGDMRCRGTRNETARLQRSHVACDPCAHRAAPQSGHCPHRCRPTRLSTTHFLRKVLAIGEVAATPIEPESKSLPTCWHPSDGMANYGFGLTSS